VRDFPLASFKLDRSFVAELSHSDANRTIVQSMCAMGAGLGLTVVAEGVETEEQAKLLRGYGCQLAQGYLFARPLAPDDFTRFAANWARRSTSAPPRSPSAAAAPEPG
jgi:EAL domain-containing protein (putative c-di-GMP-specific phosphodiesterase class I)